MVKQDLHGYFDNGAYHEGIHPSSFVTAAKQAECIMEKHTRNHPLKFVPLNDAPYHYPVCNCGVSPCNENVKFEFSELKTGYPLWFYPICGLMVAIILLLCSMIFLQ